MAVGAGVDVSTHDQGPVSRMSDEGSRWPVVKEIFHAALARPPEQRTAFLRERCRNDDALREDVESLLDAHAEAGQFAESPAIGAMGARDLVMSPDTVPALVAGVEFGAYRILAPLDAGGMGEVYRAVDTRLHREVAIKVLPMALASHPELVARVEREARLLAALNHPNIATIHGLEVADGVRAVVMELIEGPTLADRLGSGPLPLDLALAIARQIAEALEAAHEKGIVHRDLKPANIKLTATGAAKVLDFGLAKAMTPDFDAGGAPAGAPDGPTPEGVVAGTPTYMSPEQARGQRVDERSDIWAFGCVLYELLTARSAFGRATIAETLVAILEREPDWELLSPTVPAGIRRVLRRCLEKDRRRRLHHIADARIEIEDAARDAEAFDVPQVSASPRRWGLIVSTAVLTLAVIAVMASWWLRPSADRGDQRVAEITTPWTSDLWAFALSPDGRRIAYVADHEGQPALWVRSLDAAGARVLPGTERARGPFWSADSRSIGFFADSNLRRIEARGGAPQTVTYALAGTNGTWGSDGTILFSSTPVPALRRVNAAGGNVEPVTTPATDSTGHRHPQFLPGGRQFLFFVGGPDPVRGVYLGTLESADVTRLLASDTQAEYLAPGWLVFVRQGTLLAQRFDVSRRTLRGEPMTVADAVSFDPISGSGAFSTSTAGVIAYRAGRPPVTRLSWFDRSGKAHGTLGPPEQSGLSTFTLSPDGRRVAAERTLQNATDVWLLDTTRQTRFTHGAGGNIARVPVWSRDGGRLAFESVGSHSIRLSMKRLSGDVDEHILFDSPEVKVPCDWSPDGRLLMYYVPDPKTGTDLWVLSEGKQEPSLFLRTSANELWGQFSPDGRWVVYQSNETGQYEIYVRPFAKPGEPVPISTAGGVYPRWSRDGKELYFIAPDAKMMAVPIRATAEAIDAGVPVALFQTRRVGGGSNVIGRGHQYDVGRDGRFIINVDAEASAPPLTLLWNWRPLP
jgi:serine/threonine protein kinase/Tol biopolymer transport system component